jgi:uncharacterized membrane protein
MTMPTLKKSIEVNVPLRVAYDQWTQFEEFPSFMEGIEAVRQLDDRRLYWRAKIGGKVEEWDAEITEQQPDQVIAWRSTSGAQNDGVVRFTPLSEGRTRVDLELRWEPKDATEGVAEVLGADDLRVQGDLGRFKEFIESRGVPTGGWRGRIEGEQVEEDAGSGSRG